jgi:geranylgeranyl pyrophosphate synthase
MDFPQALQAKVSRIEEGIERLLPGAGEPSSRLHTAMRYSMQAGGKRLRPVLVLSACELLAKEDGTDPLPAAVATECVHTYSLVHDDLPCMDDDRLRRGRPTAHVAFDEATALLAGDALLTRAFEILAGSYPGRPDLTADLVRELADAAGSRRLIGGQMEDLLAERSRTATPDTLSYIHRNKTGAMIEASLAMGGRCAGASKPVIETLRAAGAELGLAFQIVDDILDATADTATLGKTAGKDAKAGKATYVSVHGLPAARGFARERSELAIATLRRLPGDTGFLTTLAASLLERKH